MSINDNTKEMTPEMEEHQRHKDELAKDRIKFEVEQATRNQEIKQAPLEILKELKLIREELTAMHENMKVYLVDV